MGVLNENRADAILGRDVKRNPCIMPIKLNVTRIEAWLPFVLMS